jgi:hypothetical protein
VKIPRTSSKKARVRIAVVALLLATLPAIVWERLLPRYKGQTLSQWTLSFKSLDSEQRDNLLQAFGTNAVVPLGRIYNEAVYVEDLARSFPFVERLPMTKNWTDPHAGTFAWLVALREKGVPVEEILTSTDLKWVGERVEVQHKALQETNVSVSACGFRGR